jgi:hypothetical protein
MWSSSVARCTYVEAQTYGAPQAHGRELRVCAGGTLCHADDLPFRPSSTPSAQGAQLLPLLH